MKHKSLVCLGTVLVFTLIPLVSADWSMLGSDPLHSGVGTSGPVSGPKQLWNYTTPGSPITASAVVANGVVYIGLEDGVFRNWGSYVDAFDEKTGAILWRYGKLDGMSSPAVVNGVVYIAGNYSFNALNATNGQLIWKCCIDYNFGDPTVDNGVVYVGSSDRNGPVCMALNAADGALIWNFSTAEEVQCAPAVYEGIVYINAHGYLYALNAANGKLLWNYDTIFGGSPAVANGIVYAGSVDYGFYALNAKTGANIWSFNITGQMCISGASPSLYDGVVYVGSANGQLYALNALNGEIIWNFTTHPIWNSYNYPVGTAVIAGGAVYFGAGNGAVYGLNVTNGLQLWNFTLPRYFDNGWAISSTPAVDNGMLFIGSFYGCLYAFGSDPSAPAPTQPITTLQPTADPTDSQPTCSPIPQTSPTPETNSTVQAVKQDGTNITLTVNGNITVSQISNTTLTTDLSANASTISFSLTGHSGDTGLCNITIPKSVVTAGTTPAIYIDNEKAPNQGYTQDANNYYAWHTTHFSTHNISIVFSAKAEYQNLPFPLWAIGLIAVLVIIIVAAVVVIIRHGKKEAIT